MSSFVHLHVHSAYSLRESTLRIEDMIHDAVEYEMPAIALTDTNAMYAAIPFYQAATKANLRPILGAQLYVSIADEGEKSPQTREQWRHALDPIVVLARNMDGYRALTRLVSLAKSRGHLSYITFRELAAASTDCVCLVGGGESTLLRQFADTNEERAQRLLSQYANAVPSGQLFADVQDHQMPIERGGLPGLIKSARALDIPIVATNDVHYRHREDAELHQAYAGLEFEDASVRWPNDAFYLARPDEMEARFVRLPEAVENTLQVAEMCRLELPLHQVRMPTYTTKDGRATEDVLRNAAVAGAKQRFGALNEQVLKRLTYELDVICEMGFADYFLVVADFIRFAHQNGISTGPGRGSAAGSLVAYALRITDVDPVANGLLFERFLNPARVSLPDIDTDFEYERRGEVISYVVSKYGRDKVAQIGTFGTLAARAAVRDAGRMLQLDGRLVDKMAKMIPGMPGTRLKTAKEEVRGFAEMLASDANAKRLYDTACDIEGLPHHTSVHAAGVVISPDSLADWVPLEPGAENIPVTQFAMADVEALGLVKMDFLGLKTLTLMDDCLRSVRERTGETIDWRRVPDDDPTTYEMLTRAETGGVFQLDSPGMKRVLKQLRPTDMDDIVAVISLNRPGPMENIPTFVDAKHGRAPIRYPHPDLEPILRDTYGVIVYQEQIMHIASLMAGFTLGQADLLRRAVSKKKREVLDEERERFLSGCLKNGYDEKAANDVYDLIVRFADYGFNRSHAAAYAVLAYRTAYLRAHYLPDFLAALMTMSMASPDKIKTYTQDARRHQIAVRPPSVSLSGRGYSVDPDGAIRTGLLAIRNVGEGAVESILEARSEKAFSSLRDFLRRVNSRVVNRKATDSLLAAGAFDEFFPQNSTSHAKVQMLEEALRLADEDRQFAGLGLVLSEHREASRTTEQKGQEVLYIRYSSRGDDEKQALKRVQQVLQSSPGDVPVALYDGATRRTRLLGAKWQVTLSPDLMTMLEDIVGIGNVKVSLKKSTT
ncbi:DNA polymerase III subunit alpha [Alicyclobacillus dauci]|uniref:DNA-directed DNA polymerase n=1 Tax=Alicyclobacillus dauci TaxID=1475485 RepID=A0ABY6Z503_9BACL|nr:DNA polymerase III subunit alpha [Alicyclobacillus dauci]WAH37936.1 DNA polymerase III subunit alpha [Alicyclobacillus dauci]